MISIIIPVYNAESSLERCVESLITQTYTDWEMILVDDGSSDKSVLMCDQYAMSDKRIKVFHLINSGVSAARNYGLSKAQGEWVLFIDSDDYADSKYFEDFLKYSKDVTEKTLVVQGLIRENAVSVLKIPFEEAIYDKKDLIEGLLHNNLFTFGAPYCKLYNNKLLKRNNITFPLEYNYGEDTIFFLRYLLYVDSLYISPSCNYHYVEGNTNSLSRKCHSFFQLKAYFIDFMDSLKNLSKESLFTKNLLKINRPSIDGLLKRMILDMYRQGYTKSQLKKCYRDMRCLILEYKCFRFSRLALIILFCPSIIFNILLKYK